MTATTSDDQTHVLPEALDLKKISAAVTALVTQSKTKSEDALFPEISTRLLMEITSFKIPSAENHFFNIVLPHSPYPSNPDILLIIPDDVKTSKEPEIIVAEVKDKLRQAGIRIREVMTLKQLRNEYSTMEAKRQLAKRIDLVLSDIRVFKNLAGILGREFYRKKKLPISLPLESNLQVFDPKDFAYAVKKTVFNMSTNGPTSAVVVGHTNLTCEELTENISKISNWLLRNYPGGWENVKKLAVYVADIPPLIVYLSEGSRNDVKQAIGKSKKLPPPEEDELSTMPGRRVRVHASGKIDILKEDKLDDDDKEIIRQLGVEKELKDERIRNKPMDKTKLTLNIEEKFVEETQKRQDFEDEEAEAAAAAEAENEKVASKSPKRKKSRGTKGKGKKAKV